MLVFKDGMQDFKGEMLGFKNEMLGFKDGMQDFKNEMLIFKNEIRQDTVNLKEELRYLQKDMNKKWGDMANKLGTLIEDLINPAIKDVIKKYFKSNIDYKGIRIRKSNDRICGEFDIIASSSSDKKVFLVEVKSSVTTHYVRYFKSKTIPRFKELFPEYAEYTLIPIFASITLDDSIIKYMSKQNIYAMAYREWNYMDILNYNDIC
jgi:hypothetical protein